LKKRTNTPIHWQSGANSLHRLDALDSNFGMRKVGFLTADERQTLMDLSQDGLAPHRLARRANALILLDRGMSYRQVAAVLLIDDDTVSQWRLIFETEGVEGLAGFHFGGRQAFLAHEQQTELAAWVTATLPRTTREVGAFIEQRFGVSFASRSGLITLLHRLGFVHRKPVALSSRMDAQKQRTFIDAYDNLLNHLPYDEMVMFADAVHPVYGAQPVGCWAPPDVALAVEQTTGREHLNIQGAVDLESGQTQMLLVERVDAQSTIAMLSAIERQFPARRRIHVFVDNARCHRAKLVQHWLHQPNRRVRLRFIPPYCPHLNPIERLWGVMHKALTHNRCAANLRAFQKEVLTFLRWTVPKNWPNICDAVSDNFRVRDPAMCRIIK
jgi:transposase